MEGGEQVGAKRSHVQGVLCGDVVVVVVVVRFVGVCLCAGARD